MDNKQLEQQIKVLQERLDDLENTQLMFIKHKLDCQKLNGENNRRLTLYLTGMIAVTMAGLTVQNGQFSWALNTETMSQLVEILGIMGFTGLTVGAGLSMRDRN